MKVAEFPGERWEAREPRAPRFKLVPFDEIRLGTQRRYLVKGLIPRVGLTVIWGPPKCGKSFWAFDVAMHVALGWEYRDRRTHHGAVVYAAFEGQEGFKARKEAFCQHSMPADHGPVPFYLLPTTVDLVSDHKDLITAIKDQLEDARPVLVVLDTLNRSLRGSESSDEDMGAYIKAADAIRAVFDCAVAIVHHCGTDISRPRGHTSLGGAVEAQIAVKRDTAENVVAIVEFMKDGPSDATVVSRLDQVDVSTDEDGDTITSCVVVPAEASAAGRTINRKLSDRQRLALDALAECSGKSPPNGMDLPAGIIVVDANEWRREIYRLGVLDPEAKNPREDFRRLKNQLQARNIIGFRDDPVWRA